MLWGVEHVIVDEVHALAPTKRGTHLALSLERLETLITAAGHPAPQRIGLSATQRPLSAIAAYLGGVGPDREVTIADAGARKALDLRVVVPVEDMSRLGELIDPDEQPGGPAAAPEARRSIWPAIYPELLELIRSHRSTLVFVNSRRLAERMANRLNELAGEELVRAHHGSIAREQRLEIEESLKAGRLPALVATSAAIGRGRAATDRSRWAPSRRALDGDHLPQVPRRPARGRGRHGTHAGRGDRGDPRPEGAARRPRAAAGRDVRHGPMARRRPPRAGDAHRCLPRPEPGAARRRPRHALRPLPVR